MSMTLLELKDHLTTIGNALAETLQEKLDEASQPCASIETINALEVKESSLKARFEVFSKEYEAMSAEQLSSLNPKNRRFDSKQQIQSAKASLVRATIRGRDAAPEIIAALGDGNSTGGEKILPTTMVNELLHEPFVKNPLRDVSAFTNITNLEVPKITFTLGNDGFIADNATAQELAATGDVVKFGRNKFKIYAPVSETVLASTDTNLMQTVDQALQSGLAAKEKKVAFAAVPNTGEEHMSFYSTLNAIGIVTVTDDTFYKAIKAALAALHEDYRENATIMMRYSDYLEIVETLANGSATLYGVQPEQVLGKPVEFSDLAIYPIVGDFRYSHFNYDPQVLYDRDKDVKTGVWDFVLTAWFDHQIKLKSGFRIAKKE